MTKFIILFSAVMAFACGYDCEHRKIEALERIATALEKMDRNCDTRTVEIPVYIPNEPTVKKTYPSRVNGRSLKAVPTTDVFIEEDVDDKIIDDCVEKCWNKPLNNQIRSCIDKCIKEITK